MARRLQWPLASPAERRLGLSQRPLPGPTALLALTSSVAGRSARATAASVGLPAAAGAGGAAAGATAGGGTAGHAPAARAAASESGAVAAAAGARTRLPRTAGGETTVTVSETTGGVMTGGGKTSRCTAQGPAARVAGLLGRTTDATTDGEKVCSIAGFAASFVGFRQPLRPPIATLGWRCPLKAPGGVSERPGFMVRRGLPVAVASQEARKVVRHPEGRILS